MAIRGQGRSALHGRVPTEWAEEAFVTAAVATATRAAEPARKHFLMGVVASYEVAKIGLLTISYTLSGVSKTIRHFIHNSDVVLFGLPLECDENTLVSASLAAGAAGEDGTVSIWGYSLSSRVQRGGQTS